jgi:arsenite methyltransferase
MTGQRGKRAVKRAVQEHYGSTARRGARSRRAKPKCGCCCSGGEEAITGELVGYSREELAKLPEGADLGLGCGNPVAMASLKAGETVLDLGSGAGIDCFLAADRVGPTGRVIGVDMTPDMLALARRNAREAGVKNIEFRKGEIEHLPVEDASVDVIISNCVINLSPDKARVFKEAFRVLRPGGRLMVSDIVLGGRLPSWVRDNISAYVSCLAGAVGRDTYLGLIERAGFDRVDVVSETQYPVEAMVDSSELEAMLRDTGRDLEDAMRLADRVLSVKVTARKSARMGKPAGKGKPAYKGKPARTAKPAVKGRPGRKGARKARPRPT